MGVRDSNFCANRDCGPITNNCCAGDRSATSVSQAPLKRRNKMSLDEQYKEQFVDRGSSFLITATL